MLRAQDLRSHEVGAYFTHGLDANFQQLYKDHYVHIDPLMQEVSELETGIIVQTADLMPDRYKNTEFYNDYIVPQGMQHITGGFLIKSEFIVTVLGIQRSDRIGRYEQHELALIDLLVPHLQRAFQINSCLLQLTNKTNAARNSLDQLPTSIILTNASGKPSFINKQAEILIASKSGLRITRNGLKAPKLVDTRALHKLIFEASHPSHKTSGVIAIAHSSFSPPLTILVAPISNKNSINFGIDGSQATVALFLGNTGKQQKFSSEILNCIYGLTHAEARLAGELANGHSLEKIAEKFKVSKHTVRSQLKACFHKTGVNRQTQLVKLVLSSPAALIN